MSQIAITYQSATIQPLSQPYDELPAIPSNRLEEVFHVDAVGKWGHWDVEELNVESDAESLTGMECQVVEAKWGKIAQKRSREVIDSTDSDEVD